MKKSFNLFLDLLLALLISAAVFSCKIEPETKTETKTEIKTEIETKITSGTVLDGSKVQHFLQSVDTKTYVLQSRDTEEKDVKAGTLMADIAKTYTGFTAKGLSQNGTTINMYYDRNTITYTFNSGEGKFEDGSTTKTSSGLYGSLVKISEPEKSEQYFSEWKDSSGKEMATVFGAEDSTYIANYADSFVKFVKLTGADVTKSIATPSGRAFNEASEENPIKVGSFYIAETELTYKKWYRIYTWATSDERGDKIYKFQSPGRQGTRGKDGEVPTEGTEPVSNICAGDAALWCNAASERFGLTPVYQNKTDRTPIRDSNVLLNAIDFSDVYIDESANGYRLPTREEWEFAARGGDQTKEDWFYKYAGTDSEENLAEYAVYSSERVLSTANVKTKKPNSIGLYDMTGNVSEMAIGSVIRDDYALYDCYGGSAYDDKTEVILPSAFYGISNRKWSTIGFRIVCNAE